jgi:hypothetical protein
LNSTNEDCKNELEAQGVEIENFVSDELRVEQKISALFVRTADLGTCSQKPYSKLKQLLKVFDPHLVADISCVAEIW